MKELYKIFKYKDFKNYFVAFSIWHLASWVSITIIPIYATQVYGLGNQVAAIIGLRWLPNIFLGPFIGTFIKNIGPKKATILSMLSYGVALIILVNITNLYLILILVLLMGVNDAIGGPASLTLRTQAFPKDLVLLGNSLIQGVNRLSKVIGPLISALLLKFIGLKEEVYIIFVFILIAVLLLKGFEDQSDMRTLSNHKTIKIKEYLKSVNNSLINFFVFMKTQKLIMGLTITGLGYMITFGGLKIYLLWLADELGDRENLWLLFLSAQGLGALIGASLSVSLSNKIKDSQLKLIYISASVLEALLLGLLIFSENMNTSNGVIFIFIVLIIAGIPETICFIAYYTLLHKRLTESQLADYHSVTLPIYDAVLFIGISLAGVLLNFVSIKIVLLICVSFTILPFIPYLKLFLKKEESRKE